MAKVFTITEGLENMGALRTGGQGSVYKGRRIGEIYTAVKLLPTPVLTENAEDKNFRNFQNEVVKLKKVNEQPNPNVVKILNSGITESGSFPFIEMEFIEGPDVEELLKAPHDPVFTIRETIKVADQLANALAHCHKVSVKHGDIKSNNVKFNIHTGNYILLDFGMSVMSDELRRTSLRHAGAIEFMAPEQNEGQMFFQTDIYSYGILLYELLAGRVPFPLKDNGETNRNAVMLAHLEALVPDLLSLRRQHMPQNWSEDKKEYELQVPQWLLNVISRCLEKRPEDRFANGMALYENIVYNSTSAAERKAGQADTELPADTGADLQHQIWQYQEDLDLKQREILSLQSLLAEAETALNAGQQGNPASGSTVQLPKAALVALILVIVGLASFAAYSLFSGSREETKLAADSIKDAGNADTSSIANNAEAYPYEPVDSLPDTPAAAAPEIKDTVPVAKQPVAEEKQPAEPKAQPRDSASLVQEAIEEINNSEKYTVTAKKAYFYDEPNIRTRRSAFLVDWNNAELTALDEKRGFIYVVFFNTEGQVTRGWLKKSDLKKIR